MKFIHLGDLHLGKNVNEFSMIEDQRFILNQILDIIKNKEVDAVLIAGDIYDRTIPSEEAVHLFDAFLTRLAKMKKTVFAISGNHDSDERLQFGSRLFRTENIFISGKYEGETEKITVQDEYGPVHIFLMPYVKASRVAHFFPEEKIHSYEEAFRTVIERCNVNTEERNIIVVHQFVTGKSEDPALSGSESAILNVGTIDKIGADCFEPFDYVAMGHIHSCQAVGKETVRYSGSPLKYSLNEREIHSTKTVPVVTLKEKGKVQIETVPLHPLREIRHLKGHLNDLISHAEDQEDYIYVTLTDEEPFYDAMARIQEIYPNTMKLDYDNSMTRAIQNDEDEHRTEDKSFHELMQEFYNMINGKDPSMEEWDILEETAREAGVIE